MVKFIKPSLLGRNEYQYNDKITVLIPTLREVRGNNEIAEYQYYSSIRIFTNTPTDMIVELSKSGLKFDKISDYSLFLLLFLQAKENLSSYRFDLVFKDINFEKVNISSEDDKVILIDEHGEKLFDEQIYLDIADLLRRLVFFEKTTPIHCGNERARTYIVNREVKKYERLLQRLERGDTQRSITMDNIILQLICNSNFKYDFKTVNDLTVFDFWSCAKQIFKDDQVRFYQTAMAMGNIDKEKFDSKLLDRNVL